MDIFLSILSVALFMAMVLFIGFKNYPMIIITGIVLVISVYYGFSYDNKQNDLELKSRIETCVSLGGDSLVPTYHFPDQCWNVKDQKRFIMPDEVRKVD